MDIDQDPHAVHVTIRGPIAEAAAVRAWITARAERVDTGLDDDPQQPGWTTAQLIAVPPQE